MLSQLLSSAAVALVASSPVYAWWRVACTTPVVTERIDPIISPNVIGSNHVHTVHGGQNFYANQTGDTLTASKCTSCEVTNDNSNYWFPKLYFHSPTDGQFYAVPNGGLLVYYQDRGNYAVVNGGPGLYAFPDGFRMISGNPILRSMDADALTDNSQYGLSRRATFFSCLRYVDNVSGYDGYGFPTSNCEAGLNHRIHMPACWDGVNIDSPSHTTHVAYLSELDNGTCPPGYPKGFMKLFFEVTWDINSFVTSGQWNPATSTFPFVLATGDPTGFSWHGDFFNGWKSPDLQNAINTCNDYSNATGQSGDTEACTVFQMQADSVATTCKGNLQVGENTAGPFPKLPGCNPIQAGPGNATIYSPTTTNCPN